jgi:hypothetical protein
MQLKNTLEFTQKHKPNKFKTENEFRLNMFMQAKKDIIESMSDSTNISI